MHGELEKQNKQEMHEKAMSANVNKEPDYDTEVTTRAREAGL